MALGVIVLQAGQHATYVINRDFNYYLQLSKDSSVTFTSKNGGSVNINYNIWGPGSVTYSGNGTMVNNGPMGVAPQQNAINGLQVFQYQGNPKFTEEIP